MSAKKRSVFGIILVVIILVLVTPFISGWMFKDKYKKLLQGLAEDLQLNIEILNYHQGWFTSDAVLKVTPILSSTNMPPIPFANMGVVVDKKIIHGPLIYDTENHRFKFGRALMLSKSTLMDDPKVIFKDSSLMTLAGNLDGEFQVTPVHFVFPFIGKMEWQGIIGTNKIDLKDYHIVSVKSDVKVKPFTFSGEAGTLKVSNIVMEMSGAYHPQFGLWDIKNTHRLASVEGAFKDAVFGLKDLQFDLATHLAQTDYNIELDVNVKQIVTPILTFNPSSIKVSLKNLDARALQTMNNPNVTPTDIKEFYLKVSTPKSVFTANTSLKTNQGDFNLDWNLNWPENTPAFQNYEALLSRMKFTANFTVSTSLMQFYLNLLPNDVPLSAAMTDPNMPSQTVSQRQMIVSNIEELQQKGILVIDKDRYVMHLIYENGVLKINNTSWPLDAKTIINEIEKAQQRP